MCPKRKAQCASRGHHNGINHNTTIIIIIIIIFASSFSIQVRRVITTTTTTLSITAVSAVETGTTFCALDSVYWGAGKHGTGVLD